MWYIILTCNRTKSFYDWGRAQGLWIPLRRQPGKAPSAAMPGYAFVPKDVWRNMRQEAQRRFNAAPLQHGDDGLPRTCHKDELIEMQKVLNSWEERGEAPPQRPDYRAGERIRITLGPFQGYEAVVEKVRGNTLRLVTRQGYLSLPYQFVARL